MIVTAGTTVEVRLPSRLGFEKVAMGTAASVAALMGFPGERSSRWA
jgi:serine/threonine-protein kinase RsbW